MIVVAIVGLMTQMILPAFTDTLPEQELKSTANKLAIQLNYLRSEARLQGASYSLQLDPEKQRYRIHMPPEIQLSEDANTPPGEEDPEKTSLHWHFLPEGVRFAGVSVGRKDQGPKKSREIRFDPRGRTPPKVLYLEYHDPNAGQEPLRYSIVIPPLTGSIRVEKGTIELPTASDYDF
jgi:type II secretory pathway pseudopilin PulG